MFKTAQSCAALLDCWKQSYIDTRTYIEESGIGSRWEFDRNVIFGELDHITRICRDIMKIAKTFIGFEEVFSNELRSIIRLPEEVDGLMKQVSGFLFHFTIFVGQSLAFE